MINFISNKSCFLCCKPTGVLYCSQIELRHGYNSYYHYHANCFLESAGQQPNRSYTREQWKQLAGDMYVLADNYCIESIRGSKFWYSNGLLHRTDGPAIEYINGDKHWYLRGRLTTKKTKV